MLCLGYIRHSFGITIWFLNREENLQLTITIFRQKITFNVFSLVPARKDFLAVQKWSHKHCLCCPSRITNTSRGSPSGLTGAKPKPHQLTTGLARLWCVATATCPRRGGGLTCAPDQIACPGPLGGPCSMLSPGDPGELCPCMIPPLKLLLL